MSAPSSAGGGNRGASHDDSPMSNNAPTPLPLPPSRKRRRVDSNNGGGGVIGPTGEEWVIRNGMWRLRIQGAKNGKASVECVLVPVKLDALSSEQVRNSQRGFLG